MLKILSSMVGKYLKTGFKKKKKLWMYMKRYRKNQRKQIFCFAFFPPFFTSTLHGIAFYVVLYFYFKIRREKYVGKIADVHKKKPKNQK
jgi:hypothetical protein